jgi:predicted butyrate kinase (DUF1464 family)
MRTIGLDPGTVTIDLCGLEDGAVFLDRAIPTREALGDPGAFVELLREARAEVIAGPSGYGLPFVRIGDATDDVLRLAYLAPAGESGGIGGLRTLARAMREAELPVVFTPGVVHLSTVPAHRKVNRVDMGTADKLCVAVLGVYDQARRRGCAYSEVSFILLELGGAFSAALAVRDGQVVDGLGGSAGPLGMCSAGALDSEVAFLAGEIPKSLVFQGGITSILGDMQREDVPSDDERSPAERVAEPRSARERLAWDAYVESATKAVVALRVAVPHPYEILVSGRMAGVERVMRALRLRLEPWAPVRMLEGFARTAKTAAQGAALMADGLAGGPSAALVNALHLREASGTVLDHLFIITPDAARRRLGLP